MLVKWYIIFLFLNHLDLMLRFIHKPALLINAVGYAYHPGHYGDAERP